MKVPIDELWIEPCTLLVERESAVTLPATCSRGALSCTRSAKLVSVSLNPVVCEFAMLPEIFCSAKDCACRPVTAVVIASKMPIEASITIAAAGSVGPDAPAAWPHGRIRRRKPHATVKTSKHQRVDQTSGGAGWAGCARY